MKSGQVWLKVLCARMEFPLQESPYKLDVSIQMLKAVQAKIEGSLHAT